jgi:hypothetical protein
MRLIKKVLRSAVPLVVIRWFWDPNHGPERRAKAREVATDLGRRVRDGTREVRTRLAARRQAPRPAVPTSTTAAHR